MSRSWQLMLAASRSLPVEHTGGDCGLSLEGVDHSFVPTYPVETHLRAPERVMSFTVRTLMHLAPRPFFNAHPLLTLTLPSR